jgi:hypothetical protein
MDVIQEILEDSTLSPAEKVLFGILYCRKEGNECNLSIEELVRYVGVQLETLRESLEHLELSGFIKLSTSCEITDASSFLSCAVLEEKIRPREPAVPRP